MNINARSNAIAIFALVYIMSITNAVAMENPHSNELPLTDINSVVPLFQAHAHNDYQHPQPLIYALDHGFTSIEADIHLVKGELYVSHRYPLFLDKERTLTKLYLDPLFEKYKANNGNIMLQPDDLSITLMIDIKSDKNKTYEKLKEVLIPYEEMLTSWNNHIPNKGAVKVIISGNRPIETVWQESKRWVQIDGRAEDIGKNYPIEFMPMISDKFSKVCGRQWFSKGISKKKLKKLNEIASKVHAEGKLFRLWSGPENEDAWTAMMQEGLDIINTDKPSKLSSYFGKRRERNKQQRALDEDGKDASVGRR